MTRSSLAEVVRTLEARPCADGYVARCPAHEDRSPSLSIAEKGGRLLFRCFTGCDYTAIRAALEARGLTLAEAGERQNFETVWTIRDASGRAMAQHVRVDRAEGKLVFWRGPTGEKARLSDIGVRLADLPLYGTELLRERAADVVVITEGEKAADAARRLGLLALGTSTGASSAPSPAALAPLRGREVILWPDADPEGGKHMTRVARNLRDLATTVRTLSWPDAPPKGDAADFVRCGLGREDFDRLLAATPARAAADRDCPLRYLHDGVAEALAELDRFAAGDLQRFVTTGVRDLDRALGGGLRRGQVTLIGAPTGAGKTTVLTGFAMAAAERGAALVISPEMSVEELAEREVIRSSGMPRWARNPWKHRPDHDRAAVAHKQAAADLRSRLRSVLILDMPGVTMDAIADAAEEAKRRHADLALVAIDYAQEVADVDPRTPRYLTVGAVAQRSVELARRLDVAVVIASQVNVVKEGRGPSQYAFRESQVLEHKASNVLLFVVDWQTDSESGVRVVDRAAFKATKNRAGALFEVAVRYQPQLYRITDVQDGESGTLWPRPAPTTTTSDEELFA